MDSVSSNCLRFSFTSDWDLVKVISYVNILAE